MPFLWLQKRPFNHINKCQYPKPWVKRTVGEIKYLIFVLQFFQLCPSIGFARQNFFRNLDLNASSSPHNQIGPEGERKEYSLPTSARLYNYALNRQYLEKSTTFFFLINNPLVDLNNFWLRISGLWSVFVFVDLWFSDISLCVWRGRERMGFGLFPSLFAWDLLKTSWCGGRSFGV